MHILSNGGVRTTECGISISNPKIVYHTRRFDFTKIWCKLHHFNFRMGRDSLPVLLFARHRQTAMSLTGRAPNHPPHYFGWKQSIEYFDMFGSSWIPKWIICTVYYLSPFFSDERPLSV